jgi:integrase
LRRFFLWAQATGRIAELPTATVKGVPAAPRAPKSLPKRDVDRLIREAQKGNKRNLAIVQLLRHTGLRVGELCALRLSDIRISERKGSVLVRSGNGDKDRTVPLNHDVREALEAYIKVRPAASDDHLFLGQRGEPLQTARGCSEERDDADAKHQKALGGSRRVTGHCFDHRRTQR